MPRGRLRPNVSSGWAEVYREAKAEAPYRDLCQAWERADLEQRKRFLREVHPPAICADLSAVEVAAAP